MDKLVIPHEMIMSRHQVSPYVQWEGMTAEQRAKNLLGRWKRMQERRSGWIGRLAKCWTYLDRTGETDSR